MTLQKLGLTIAGIATLIGVPLAVPAYLPLIAGTDALVLLLSTIFVLCAIMVPIGLAMALIGWISDS